MLPAHNELKLFLFSVQMCYRPFWPLSLLIQLHNAKFICLNLRFLKIILWGDILDFIIFNPNFDDNLLLLLIIIAIISVIQGMFTFTGRFCVCVSLFRTSSSVVDLFLIIPRWLMSGWRAVWNPRSTWLLRFQLPSVEM